MILTKKDGLSFVFKTKEGKEKSAYIPLLEIIKNLEDIALEIINTPDCNSSSCAVNNFCECDLINDDVEFKHVELNTN